MSWRGEASYRLSSTPTPLSPFTSCPLAEYLSRAIAHLLTVLKNPPERGAAFAALADMAAALARVNCAAGGYESWGMAGS